MGRYGQSKYAPLGAHLAAQPADVRQVTLTLAAVEALIGGPLPASAWTTEFWSGGYEARRWWQPHGWRGQLQRHPRTVTFTRSPP